MNRNLCLSTLCTLSFVLSGCVSWMSVEKIRKIEPDQPTGTTKSANLESAGNKAQENARTNPNGIRYNLPQPFVQVTPKPDGSIDVEVVYVPNPEEEYAISAGTFLGAHTIDVQVEGGLLKQVKFNADTAQVASALVESAGGVAEAKFNAKAEANKIAAEKEAEAEEKRIEKQEAAVQARRKAESDFNVARAKRDALEAEPTIPSDDPRLVEARVDVAMKEQILNDAKNDESGVMSGLYLDPSPGESKTAPSPVLFAVMPDGKGAKLQAVEYVSGENKGGQLEIATYSIPKEAASEPPGLQFFWKGGSVALLDKGRIQLTLESTGELVQYDEQGADTFEAKLYDIPIDGGDQRVELGIQVVLDLQPDKKTVLIDFDPETPAGSYRIDLKLAKGSPSDHVTVPVVRDIRINR